MSQRSDEQPNDYALGEISVHFMPVETKVWVNSPQATVDLGTVMEYNLTKSKVKSYWDWYTGKYWMHGSWVPVRFVRPCYEYTMELRDIPRVNYNENA